MKGTVLVRNSVRSPSVLNASRVPIPGRSTSSTSERAGRETTWPLTTSRAGRVYSAMTSIGENTDRYSYGQCRTVGRPTCPYDTFRIIDREGKECPANVPGELSVKGPGVFSGYYRAPEENQQVFDREGFFRTGDQVMMDDAGDIILTGRIKDIIVRGGENISPVEMENLIIAHPDVVVAAVVGMPDPVMGERACAYIQTRGGIEIDLEEMTAFLKDRGASVLQCPERVELIDEMPVTGAKGLIDKKVLLADIRERVLGEKGD